MKNVHKILHEKKRPRETRAYMRIILKQFFDKVYERAE
jgi:hypothetical protein